MWLCQQWIGFAENVAVGVKYVEVECSNIGWCFDKYLGHWQDC